MATTERFPVLAPPRASEETAPLGLFISVVVVASVVYSLLSTGSMGGCAGGVSSDGGYIDNAGNATEAAPTCVMIQLRPEPYVYLLLAGLALIAFVVIRRRQTQSLPTRVITVASVGVLIAVGVLFSIYHFLFVQDFLLGDWRSGHNVVLPFLSNVTIDRTPWPQ